MASRYWVGGGSSANWNATGPTNWGTASNTQDNASVPGSGDDVIFDGVGTGASDAILSANITINSLDMTGYTNTLTHNASVTLTISGNTFKLAAGMTYTLGNAATSAVTFTSTSGTCNVTTGGKTVGNFTFDGAGGTWQLQDSLTNGATAVVTLTRGSLDTNNQTLNVGFFSSVNSNTRALTMGSSAITVTGTTSNAWDFTGANATISAGTSTITMGGASTNFRATSAYTWNNVVFNSSNATALVYNGGSVANLTVTGTTTKTVSIALTGNITVTGTLTINGNSSVNRVLVTSNTLGTARTITAATVSVTNADFRDITGAGAGDWDLSAITGLSGDCGGNSGITFTTGATQYWVGGTGNWSTAAAWGTTSGGSGGRVPLPQDDVRFDANSFSAGSQTATLDMPRAGRNIDWTGVTNTPAWAKTTTSTIYGSVTLVSGMTNSGTVSVFFEGRGVFTFTSAGQTWTNPIQAQMVGGTLTLQDALTCGSASNSNFSHGTFNANGFNVSLAGALVTSYSSTRTITMGSGTWTLSGTGTTWNASTTTGLTLNKDTSTIVVSNTSATAKTFIGGGLTYNNVTFSGDNITVTGANTFNTLAINNAGLANGLKLTNGVTQTVTNITTNGSAGNLAILQSTSAGSAATISKASGTVSVDYMSIKDSTATGGATFYAGANSTNVSGNTGWTFTAPPSGFSVAWAIRRNTLIGVQ